jgi:hypothetical protein
MSNADFLGRAIDAVKKAISEDTAGEYEKAYQLYHAARTWKSRLLARATANAPQSSCSCLR